MSGFIPTFPPIVPQFVVIVIACYLLPAGDSRQPAQQEETKSCPISISKGEDVCKKDNNSIVDSKSCVINHRDIVTLEIR